MRYMIGFFFLLSIFFPWVSFRLNSLDTQPWGFIFSILFLAFCINQKINKYIFLVFLLPFFALFMVFIDVDKDFFLVFRGWGGYIFFSFVFFASFFYIKMYGFPHRILYFSNLVYLVVGVTQLVFGSEIIGSIAPIRTTESRGVTSLAVEPTNFGIVLLLFSWFILIFNNYRLIGVSKYIFIFNLFSIVLLAQSSMALCFLIIGLSFYFLYKVNIFYFLIFIFFFFFGMSSFIENFPNSRISLLVNALDDIGFLNLVLKDASLNYRVSSLIFPYQGVLENNLLPGGFSSFSVIASKLMADSHGLFWYGGHLKILSFIGAFIYELGFVGIFFVILYFFSIQDKSCRRFLESIYLLLLLSMAISVASPLVAFLLCLLIVSRRRIGVSGEYENSKCSPFIFENRGGGIF